MSAADVVFLGKVTSEETHTPSPRKPIVENNSASSMAELLKQIEEAKLSDSYNYQYQSVSLEVIKVWKGSNNKVFTTKNNAVPGQYGTHLNVGETYLVFGYKDNEYDLVISAVCGNVRKEAQSAELVQALNELTSVQ